MATTLLFCKFVFALYRPGVLWKLILTCANTDPDFMALAFLRGGFATKTILARGGGGGGVYLTPRQLLHQCKFTAVPSCGSVFVHIIPPQNLFDFSKRRL